MLILLIISLVTVELIIEFFYVSYYAMDTNILIGIESLLLKCLIRDKKTGYLSLLKRCLNNSGYREQRGSDKISILDKNMNGITESMNLCIVTVYNSINSGSFLQAFSLAQALMKMGHNVSFYERTGSQGCSNSLRKQVKSGLKILLGNGLAKAGRY